MLNSLKSFFGFAGQKSDQQAGPDQAGSLGLRDGNSQSGSLSPQDAANIRGWNRMQRLEQQLLASYEAAIKRDDLWTEADFKDADATLLPEKRRYLRAHSRYEAANNPLVDRILKVWVEDVVGETGPWLSINSGHGPLDQLLESLWSKWWKRTGQAAKLRTAVRAEAVDGESLAIRRPIPSNVIRAGIAADLVLLECDRLASPDWNNANRSNYIDGVHLDPLTQRPLAYDILKAHPGTEYLDQVTEVWEAVTLGPEDVLHAFRTLRAEQHRGLPRGTASLMLAGMIRKFLNGQVDKTALQAAFAFAIKSMAPPETEEGSTDGLWQRINLPEGRGLGIMFPDGYEPVQFRTDGDSEGIDPFMQVLCVFYAGCFAMPLGRAMGRYGSSNYPAVRGELLPYRRQIVAARGEVWEPLWLEPLYQDFLREALLLPGTQQVLSGLPEQERRSLDLYETEWHWGGEDLVVDPSREETAREKKLKLGIRTREQEFDGQDLDAADARGAEQLGIVDDQGKPDVKRYRQILCRSLHGVDPAQPAGDLVRPAGELDERSQGAGNKQPAKDRERVEGSMANSSSLDSGFSLLEANCGTGKGGFQPGNRCAKGGAGGAPQSSGGGVLQSVKQFAGSRMGKTLIRLVGAVVVRQLLLKRISPVILRGVVRLLLKHAGTVRAAAEDGLRGDLLDLLGDQEPVEMILRAFRRRQGPAKDAKDRESSSS